MPVFDLGQFTELVDHYMTVKSVGGVDGFTDNFGVFDVHRQTVPEIAPGTYVDDLVLFPTRRLGRPARSLWRFWWWFSSITNLNHINERRKHL